MRLSPDTEMERCSVSRGASIGVPASVKTTGKENSISTLPWIKFDKMQPAYLIDSAGINEKND